MSRFEQERALKTSQIMVPIEADRREAIDVVRRIGSADGEVTRQRRE